MPNGILLPAIDFAGMAEDEFNDWYDLEHIPERLRVPGVVGCERWIGTDNQKVSVVTYELDNVDVLKSEAYNAIGNHGGGGDNLSAWSRRVTARIKMLMRFEGEQVAHAGGVAQKDAPALLLNAMSVAPEHEREFNDWYDTEHIPALAGVDREHCVRVVTAEPAQPPNVLSRSIGSRPPRYPIRRPGKPPPIHRGPNGCGRISATICGSSANAIDAARRERRSPACALLFKSQFASGSGRNWMCTARGIAPLPPSLSHGVRSPFVLHKPRPFQPALGSSIRPSRPLA